MVLFLKLGIKLQWADLKLNLTWVDLKWVYLEFGLLKCNSFLIILSVPLSFSACMHVHVHVVAHAHNTVCRYLFVAVCVFICLLLNKAYLSRMKNKRYISEFIFLKIATFSKSITSWRSAGFFFKQRSWISSFQKTNRRKSFKFSNLLQLLSWCLQFSACLLSCCLCCCQVVL